MICLLFLLHRSCGKPQKKSSTYCKFPNVWLAFALVFWSASWAITEPTFRFFSSLNGLEISYIHKACFVFEKSYSKAKFSIIKVRSIVCRWRDLSSRQRKSSRLGIFTRNVDDLKYEWKGGKGEFKKILYPPLRRIW